MESKNIIKNISYCRNINNTHNILLYDSQCRHFEWINQTNIRSLFKQEVILKWI